MRWRGLPRRGARSESVELTAPSTPGTYHYGACVDAVAGESDTANNCSSSVPGNGPGARARVAGPSRT